MKDAIKFRWEGSTEHESGFAVYEVGTSSYTLKLPSLRSAILVRAALSDAYRVGYEDSLRRAEYAVQSALSKLPE
jgi:hypothetical protein